MRFILMFFPVWVFSVSVSPCPIVRGEHCTDPSLLIQEELCYVGVQSRYSTCTGVTWFPQDQVLVTANFLDNSFQFFRFDPMGKLEPIQYLKNEDGLCVSGAENIIVFNNAQWLVVPNFLNSRVNFYETNLKEDTISPVPSFVLTDEKMSGLHGVRFSPDSQYCVCLAAGNPGRVMMYRVLQKDPIQLEQIQCIDDPMVGLKPKAASFSPDGRFVVIGFAKNIMRTASPLVKGRIASYKFDFVKENLELVSVSPDNVCVEDIHFYKDGTSIFVGDQESHSMFVYEMNADTGVLTTERTTVLKNPEAELSFPHGFSFSSDYKYLAIANYGGSKVLIYLVEDTP